MLVHKEETINKLADSFRKGNSESFTELAVLIGQDIVNIAYRYTGNLESAKDVLQSVLLILYKKLHFFRREAKFSSWIYRVTMNSSIDSLSRRNRNYNLKIRYTEDFRKNPDLREEVLVRDKKRLIEKIVSGLPLRQKNVFILKHYQGFKIKEIAEILKCSASSVKTHLERAVDNIRKRQEAQHELSE